MEVFFLSLAKIQILYYIGNQFIIKFYSFYDSPYFNPCGCGTWLITEAEREGDDWRLYGYCHIFEWEWGYLLLSELESLRLPFGLGVERDLYTGGKYLRDFLSEEEIRQLEALD